MKTKPKTTKSTPHNHSPGLFLSGVYKNMNIINKWSIRFKKNICKSVIRSTGSGRQDGHDVNITCTLQCVVKENGQNHLTLTRRTGSVRSKIQAFIVVRELRIDQTVKSD